MFENLASTRLTLLSWVLWFWSCSQVPEAPVRASLQVEFDRRVQEINRQTGARQLSLEEFQALRNSGKPFLLLDIREPEEFDRAAIPDARLLPPDQVREFSDAPEARTTIITYCTVGYRSGQAAARLEKQLKRPVYNLNGGILRWFNRGGEVVTPAGEPAKTIHPYNSEWARFVVRSTEP